MWIRIQKNESNNPDLVAKTRLCELDDFDLDLLVANGHRKALQPDQTLLARGSHSHCLYVVLKGRLSVTVDGQSFGMVDRGHVLGELEFFTSLPPIATLLSVEASEVYGIAFAQLLPLLRTHAPFAFKLHALMGCFAASRARQGMVDDQQELVVPDKTQMHKFQHALARLSQAPLDT